MTVRATDIAQIALEARRLGETLITPCPCGHTDQRWLKAHTIGEHIYDSTRAMAPGPRAQAFTPTTASPSPTTDTEPPPDPDMHARYTKRATDAWAAIRALQTFVDGHRPDQTAPTGPTFSDDEWCRNHLDKLGICEPRYRGDTCRRCYSVKLITGHLPPRSILEDWRNGARVTDQSLAAAIAADQQPAGKAKKGKRRKAR